MTCLFTTKWDRRRPRRLRRSSSAPGSQTSPACKVVVVVVVSVATPMGHRWGEVQFVQSLCSEIVARRPSARRVMMRRRSFVRRRRRISTRFAFGEMMRMCKVSPRRRRRALTRRPTRVVRRRTRGVRSRLRRGSLPSPLRVWRGGSRRKRRREAAAARSTCKARSRRSWTSSRMTC